jgi:hypothetical protein
MLRAPWWLESPMKRVTRALSVYQLPFFVDGGALLIGRLRYPTGFAVLGGGTRRHAICMQLG